MPHMDMGGGALLWRILLPAGAGATGQKRAFPRWNVHFPLLYGVGTPTALGTVLDLSDEGLGFRSARQYRVDSVLDLELKLDEAAIAVKALVRRCSDGVVGVQFLNLSRSNRLRVIDYCLGKHQPSLEN
jgi:PilZ domain